VAAPATTLGADLGLTRYTGAASSVALDVADSWGGVDLGVGAAGRRVPAHLGGDDLTLVSERANLGQALIMRLLTPIGSLAPLGHGSYGSRLVELIGRTNDETTRNLARLYTIQAVGEERRAVLRDLVVDVPPGRPDVVRISFSVVPVGQDEPMALGLEVAL
jgi:hypothetical protein